MNELPQKQLGYRRTGGISGLLSRIFGKRKVVRATPGALEQQRFQSEVREQLMQLKKKGLSIPVFTL